ncbi:MULTISPECIES: FixH family protein [Undibacterium]|uniref:FixH family protein n=1 Tax=Undibacterium aquatile TaxID=1537398 RepID=A0ABR6XIP5_9BURK|nr:MULTISPECIES: FixH family protein [Undibacterium]MBC3812784.1 FixH family protein [Undibacterium aquatile]MBK1891120.1 FixH family protein [Undibacterium sp. 14-3-2]MBY0571541.1 FixH family protein [Burkholderiaceae bacterium]
MDAILISKKRDKWFKEPWLLLVAGGPAIVVCASIFTGAIAFRGADKVVAEDYYKQGLMINKDIQRDAKSRELHLGATLSLDVSSGKLRMQLKGDGLLPDTVKLSLANAAEGATSVNEVVHRLPMVQVSPGIYEGDLKLVSSIFSSSVKLFHIKLETTDWRLTGDWFEPEQKVAQLGMAK